METCERRTLLLPDLSDHVDLRLANIIMFNETVFWAASRAAQRELYF